MMHKGVLMEIEVDQVAKPYSDAMARRYFKEMMLGIEYCKSNPLFVFVPVFTILTLGSTCKWYRSS